jgi:hypothetical protein
MAISENLSSFTFTNLPKVIGPGGHALLDYALFATTLSAAWMFGRRNRVVGISALLTALLEGVNVAATDFPGRNREVGQLSGARQDGFGNVTDFCRLAVFDGLWKAP